MNLKFLTITLILVVIFLQASTIVLAQSVDDPVLFAKNLMKKYSSVSFFILDQDEKCPRSFDFDAGGKMDFTSVNDLKEYIKSNQIKDILADLNTGVHETTHDYTSVLGYKLLLEKGVKNIGTNFYQCYNPENNNEIVVKINKSFPSAEINSIIEDDFQTERFATYVFPSRKNQGTQVNGVFGLLDEFHAYYHGTKAVFDLQTYFENEREQTAASWTIYFRNYYSTYFAYAEFKYFILKYLIYAREKHPEMYEKIMDNDEFKDAFLRTEKSFLGMINEFKTKQENILNALKSKGISVVETDEKFSIDNTSVLTFSETFNAFLQALNKKECTEMMSLLSSKNTVRKTEDNSNMSAVKLQFDASSMAASFGDVKSVNVIGSFNDFDVSDTRFAMSMVPGSNYVFEITMKLKPGKYLYKLNIDGMYLSDMTSAGFMLSPAPLEFEKDKEGGNAAVLIVK